MIESTQMHELLTNVTKKLDTALLPIKVVDGFCEEQFFGVLEKPLLSVFIKQISITEEAFGGVFGERLSLNSCYSVGGRQAKICFEFKLSLPMFEKTIDAQTVFLQIYQTLVQSGLAEFQVFSSDKMLFEESTQSFSFTAYAEGIVLIAEELEHAVIREIQVVKK